MDDQGDQPIDCHANTLDFEVTKRCQYDVTNEKIDSRLSSGGPKVKEKVAWFSHRSSQYPYGSYYGSTADIDFGFTPSEALPNEANVPNVPRQTEAWMGGARSDISDMFPSDTPSTYTIGNSVDTSSSSDDFIELNGIRKSQLYPNSEIDEQNCLKPSVARAIFHQMEKANYHGKPKFTRPKKKRMLSYDSTGSEDNANSLKVLNHNCKPVDTRIRTLDEQNLGYISSYPTQFKASESLKPKSQEIPQLTSRDVLGQVRRCSCKPNLYAITTSQIQNHSDGFKSKHNEHWYTNQSNAVLNFNKFKYHSLPSEFSYLSKKDKLSHDQNMFDCHGNRKAKHLSICDDWYKSSSCLSVCNCHLSKNSFQNELHGPIEQKQRDVKQAKVVSFSKPEKISPVTFRENNTKIQGWFSEFDDEQKNQVLSQLLNQCGLPQIHLLSINLEDRLHQGCPPNCQDLIAWLPRTVSLYIFSFLEPASLCQASLVCQTWNELMAEPCLWRKFCLMPKWRLSVAGEHKQIINHMLPNGDIYWKRVFGERYRLRNNWLTGRCHIRTFEGHTQGVSCVQFDDTRIVSGSTDKTIKVWNIRTNTPWLVQTLTGHSGTVRCLHLDGNRLVSGSTDRTIKVWDLSRQQSWSSIACKVTMIGHTDTVRCLQVDDEKVISGSYDKTLKIWNIRTGQCKKTLRGHGSSVLCVKFDAFKIMSGSADKTIRLWNFEGQCLMIYEGHQDAVTCLQFDSTRVISGSLDCTLKFWDINQAECVNTIDWKASEGHTRVVRDLQADSWKLVSASDDRTIKVWSLETGQRLATLRNHTDGVTCVQFNDNFIVSGSYDKSVKLWDFSCC